VTLIERIQDELAGDGHWRVTHELRGCGQFINHDALHATWFGMPNTAGMQQGLHLVSASGRNGRTAMAAVFNASASVRDRDSARPEEASSVTRDGGTDLDRQATMKNPASRTS